MNSTVAHAYEMQHAADDEATRNAEDAARALDEGPFSSRSSVPTPDQARAIFALSDTAFRANIAQASSANVVR